MKRRQFLVQSPLALSSLVLLNHPFSILMDAAIAGLAEDPFSLFQDTPSGFRPWVRWWWNGDKVNREELLRELRLLKEAGIGGVEINPIQFPIDTDDLGIASLPWLGPDWIATLGYVLDSARSLGLACDLLVGSGWPFGAEYLEDGQRSQIMITVARILQGPLDYETSLFDLFKEADPAITSPFAGRIMTMRAIKLVPFELEHLDQVRDLSDQIDKGRIKLHIGAGKYVLYGLVHVSGFMQVINGAPGANGPVLNHYDRTAVQRYLDHMSGSLQGTLGPLSGGIRALFADSLELEGANWCSDMEEEFNKRRGYALMPFLPFILFKIGSMGNTYDYSYGASFSPALEEQLCRVRYDFNRTLSELLTERFVQPFQAWCSKNGVKSRMQAYGRGYLPVEGSFGVDIPECETWVQYGLGHKMSDSPYHEGRAYTIVNKYVSSAARLQGKRLVNCEELTNIYRVFNTTLEICKLAGDQSFISGATQAVFHGFGYSPPEAPFPGWVRYGTYLNERNPWWPHFRKFVDYKARLSAVFQQGELFADVALLSATPDLWSLYGAQNNPFPFTVYPTYGPLIWEAIHHNGGGCDYVSENIIRQAKVEDGLMYYGPRAYKTIFLIGVERMEPATAERLYQFVASGGRIFCIGRYPDKSPGYQEASQRDTMVRHWVELMKDIPGRCIRLDPPRENFVQWYKEVQRAHGLVPYVDIDTPNRFVSQVRYRLPAGEALFFINSDVRRGYRLVLRPNKALYEGRYPWVWDPHSGKRFRLPGTGDTLEIALGPADSRLIVFDPRKQGTLWDPAPETGNTLPVSPSRWTVTFEHIDGTSTQRVLPRLQDISTLDGMQGFGGIIRYRGVFQYHADASPVYINLGKVFGTSEVFLNGSSLGVQWFGHRIYPLREKLRHGDNELEIRVATVSGNYLKTEKDNAIGQYWTNAGRKVQPFQPVGMLGPVHIYAV